MDEKKRREKDEEEKRLSMKAKRLSGLSVPVGSSSVSHLLLFLFDVVVAVVVVVAAAGAAVVVGGAIFPRKGLSLFSCWLWYKK